jgi:hypothetical protein
LLGEGVYLTFIFCLEFRPNFFSNFSSLNRQTNFPISIALLAVQLLTACFRLEVAPFPKPQQQHADLYLCFVVGFPL